MPAQFVIYDTTSDVYLKHYEASILQCLWSAYSPTETIVYTSLASANAAIAGWGGNWGSRFIGKNPPPH